MKLALIGHGKMGKLVEQIALNQGHEVIAVLTSQSPVHSFESYLYQADVCIDFSHRESVLGHICLCRDIGKPLIIGTTGWEKNLDTAKTLIEGSSIGCLYSPNFSIGIHLFLKIVADAAKLIAPFNDYDIAGLETHHNQKVDKPSGTAKALTQVLKDHVERCKALEFTSVRCGHVPGTHTIYFDSPVDTITLTHQARNREGFAHGALCAAEWIIGKKGFFTMQDLLNNYDPIDSIK